MTLENEWQYFYNNIKNESWPTCPDIEHVLNLPPEIQLEIIKNHLFESRYSRIQDCTKHIDINVSNFLHYIDEIKNLIGRENCLMNNQDVVFLYSILISKRPTNILEIGRYKGWSTSIIYGACQDNNQGNLYSVDIHDNVSRGIKELVKNRVTFINDSSQNLLEIDLLKNLKFEVFFIDGDHSYNMVLSDLRKSVELSTDEAWFLMHDADCAEVIGAVNTFLKSRTDVVDCGTYGEKIKLLYKRKEQ